MSKVTLATVKAFINTNRANLHVLCSSTFDGMTDCVQPSGQKHFTPATESDNAFRNNMGIRGVWFVFGSRDYFTPIDEAGFIGYRVSNCCGSFMVAIPKQAIAA